MGKRTFTAMQTTLWVQQPMTSLYRMVEELGTSAFSGQLGSVSDPFPNEVYSVTWSTSGVP